MTENFNSAICLMNDEDVLIVIVINAHPSLFKSIVSLFAAFSSHSFFCLSIFYCLCKLFSILFKEGSKRTSSNLSVLFMLSFWWAFKENLNVIDGLFPLRTNSMPKDNICCDKRLRKGIIRHNSFAYDANHSLESRFFCVLSWQTAELIPCEIDRTKSFANLSCNSFKKIRRKGMTLSFKFKANETFLYQIFNVTFQRRIQNIYETIAKGKRILKRTIWFLVLPRKEISLPYHVDFVIWTVEICWWAQS